MNLRVVRAAMVLELRRRRSMVLKVLGAVAVCGVITIAAPRPIMIIAVIFTCMAGIVGIFTSTFTAMAERMIGRVVWWRTLPAPAGELVFGRIIGAALLGLLLPFALLPALTAAIRAGMPLPGAWTIAGALGVIGLLAMGVAATATGAALKLKIEFLFVAAVMANFIDNLVFDGLITEWLEVHATMTWNWFTDSVGSGALPELLGGAVVVMGVGTVAGMLLTRWAYATAVDSDAGQPPGAAVGISRINWRGVRYPAGLSGTAIAMMVLQLRLVAEKLPQQLALLVAGTIALPFLPDALASFVAIYLPVIAAGIPAGIIGRTARGKATGTLEGIATLPARRELLALGTVMAIAAAALIGTGAVTLIRFSAGRPLGLVAAFAIWGLMTGSMSMGNGMAAWFKPRHFVVVGMVAVIGVVGLSFAMIPLIVAPHTATAAAIHLDTLALIGGTIGLLLIAPLGGALYGRGLERYELVRK